MSRRVRRGRKPSQGPREANGKPQRQARNAVPLHAVLKRLELAGVCLARAYRDGVSVPITLKDALDFMREMQARPSLADGDLMARMVERGSPDYPLLVLEMRGLLAAMGEAPEVNALRGRVAARYARLSWSIFGAPAKAQSYEYASPLNEADIEAMEHLQRSDLSPQERAMLAEAMLHRMRSALLKCGRHVAAVVDHVVLSCGHPAPGQLPALRRGLAALVAVKPIRIADVGLVRPVQPFIAGEKRLAGLTAM